MKPERVKRDSFSRRIKDWALTLAAVTTMTVAARCSASTLYFPGPSTNATPLLFKSIACGGWHSLGVQTNGTVVAWGDNSMGQTNVPAGLSEVMAISAGAFHNLALKSDGTVVAWGANGAGQSTVPAGLGNVVGVAAGERHSLALKSDGTIMAWGDNSYGQSTVPVVYTADLNLQDTVDEAQNGDTILVAPGQYNLTEQVIITNAVTLQSEQGAGVTVLNLGSTPAPAYSIIAAPRRLRAGLAISSRTRNMSARPMAIITWRPTLPALPPESSNPG
ncbi:MAG TPA: hypothetical protein VNX46_14575 [Candidatus Acidoferrum sp.]|jgi:hypothetical protein|nr:hypothetical protein [Candidatus Acidoferrum sp.]